MSAPQLSVRDNASSSRENELIADIRTGLLCRPKELSPKYFYDERGSRLFERICELPEYYQTRTERGIILANSAALVDLVGSGTVVELGAGNASKSRLFLEAAHAIGKTVDFVPVDISSVMLEQTAVELRARYPWVAVHPVAADFTRHISVRPSSNPRLILFLGGTIGNFGEAEGAELLARIASAMNTSDRFVLGIDLVKDPAILHAAYNDADGVTADFNLNVLRVLNREAGAAFNLTKFRHYAFYNPHAEQIEMHLASVESQTVPISALNASVEFERGETIRTEISRKFSRGSVERLLELGGMQLEQFLVDDHELFALCVARRINGVN